jgi:hypothetical protein
VPERRERRGLTGFMVFSLAFSPSVSRPDSVPNLTRRFAGWLAEREAVRVRLRQLRRGLVSGTAPRKNREPDLPQASPFCPVRNLSAQSPPILLIHGTNDTGVPHEFISVPGAGHGLRGVDKTVVDGIYQCVLAFLQLHVG